MAKLPIEQIPILDNFLEKLFEIGGFVFAGATSLGNGIIFVFIRKF